MIKLMIIGDTHTGSPVGLTTAPRNEIQRQVLDRYVDALSWFGDRPEFVVHMGDMTEGVDSKLDIDSPQITEQYSVAAETIVMAGAQKEYFLIRGTPTHASVNNQHLEELAVYSIKEKHREIYDEDVEVTLKNKLNVTFNDWFCLSARHFIGASSIPHGRATAPTRSQMWNILNSALRSQEKKEPAKWPDLLVFGHVHYYQFVQNAWGSVLVVPSFKALGDHYGDTKCDGHVDMGMVRIEIGDTEEEGWDIHRRLYNCSVVSRMEHR